MRGGPLFLIALLVGFAILLALFVAMNYQQQTAILAFDTDGNGTLDAMERTTDANAVIEGVGSVGLFVFLALAFTAWNAIAFAIYYAVERWQSGPPPPINSA